MSATPSLEASFTVHSYEVDASGTLRLPALAGYLQEIAGEHAAALGVGLERLRAEGRTWVLSREAIRVERPLVHRDVLTVETWPSGVDRLFALREFLVRAGADVVARATSAWLVVDVATRRCEAGAHVLSRVASVGAATYAHAVVREGDGRELARVRSGWVARDAAPAPTFW